MNRSPYQNVILCLIQFGMMIYYLNKYKTRTDLKIRQDLYLGLFLGFCAVYNYWKLSPNQLTK